ncbi:hypothetical protein [Anthocerotibacter panamensis]|uniref:hypothetical protein n=1 Tax=Anthocerotibacter panamensis TaxID=2857077 RepID=UPI001C4044C2|nr:hypothetical protein [Anthocerotibacter panamensis]
MEKTASPWQLKDYVFAAFMGIGVLLAAVVSQPIAALIPIPGIRSILWAPLAGIFLTLGMARLQRPGTLLLILAPVALVLGLVNPLITLVLLIPAVLTEALMSLRGGYAGKMNRLWGNILYFESTVVAGVGFAVSGLTAAFNLKVPTINPWYVFPALLITAGVGGLGWSLGERVVRQLQKAGKLDAEV